MHISLIGMSNSGKSYLSSKLKEQGFVRICCDEMIAKKIGLAGVDDVASWMGQPYESGHKQRSAQYLELETAVMRETLAHLKTFPADTHIVIDTTGSVIYTEHDVLQELIQKTTVIYLDTPDHVKEEMFESYIRHPKPVIWGDQFSRLPDELDRDALARCYPKLLTYRIARYKRYAHITLDYFWLRHPEWTIDDLLQRLI